MGRVLEEFLFDAVGPIGVRQAEVEVVTDVYRRHSPEHGGHPLQS